MNGNPRLKTGLQRSKSTKKIAKPLGGGKQWGLKTMAKGDATHNTPRLRTTILPR